MRIIILALCFPLACAASAHGRESRKQIFRAYRLAVVRIVRPNAFGVGFITSSDGTIVTANHVVSTESSGYRDFSKSIKVLVTSASGKTTAYRPLPLPQSPERRVNFDTAVLRIPARGLPHVELGDADTTAVGDDIAIIPAFPGLGTMLLEGTVSGKSLVVYRSLGPLPMKVIFFQSPVRNGFSGSPLFNSHGQVVGIVDTKVFGITPALESARKQIEAGERSGRVILTGVDPLAIEMALIQGLDQGMISGLGSAVDIDYAKEVERASQTQRKR